LIDDESEGQFESNCDTFVTRMRHCSSQEEYTTVLHEYETFVTEYARAHPGCHYPSAPAFAGSVVAQATAPHVVIGEAHAAQPQVVYGHAEPHYVVQHAPQQMGDMHHMQMDPHMMMMNH